MTFIQLFFDNLNVEFPFLAYDETIRQFLMHDLTPLLANCIAAHAVRFADIAEVTQRGIMHVSDQYCDCAKVWPYRRLVSSVTAFRLCSWTICRLCLLRHSNPRPSIPCTPSSF